MGSSFYDDGHEHGHSHHHHGGGWRRVSYVGLCAVIAALLLAYATGLVRTVFGLDLALLITVVAGYPLIRHAFQDLLRGHFSSHLTIAIAAVAAVAVGEYFAAAEVMFIMLVGEGLEHWTVDRAKGAIAGFVGALPSSARLLRGDAESGDDAVEVPIAELAPGDRVQVRAGERIPVDGVIESGSSTVDQRWITGEPMPVAKDPGSEVWSGSVNEYGVLVVRTERAGDGTTVARIAHLIEEAQLRRAPIVRVADRLARWFLPAILVAAGLIWLFTGEILRTVAALIVACPCALVLATPAAMAAAIARLGKEGALVKGGEVLEALAGTEAVAFDKTGTLTLGRPTLDRVVSAPGFDEDTVLRLAAAAERDSEHLLGAAVLGGARKRKLDVPSAAEFEPRPGAGVVATVEGQSVQVGSLELVAESVSEEDCLAWARRVAEEIGADGTTAVVVAVEGRVAGVLALKDPLRDDAAATVARLRDQGLEPVVMLTGDASATARSIAKAAGIDRFYSSLLPDQKVDQIRQMKSQGRAVLMVGDGINDAPALATADVGVALGPGAADLSAEASQIVLFKDRLGDLPHLVDYSRKVLRRIRSSILFFAFGVNFTAVGLAAFGLLGPALAAIVHQAASLAVILNCVRLLWEGRALEEPSGPAWSRVPGLGPLARGIRRTAKSTLLEEVLHRPRRSLGHLGHQVSHRLDHAVEDLPTLFRRTRPFLLAVLCVAWLGSGLARVGPAEVTVVQRFGRHVATLGPGLHLRWPWPVERRKSLEPALVRTVEVGIGNPALIAPVGGNEIGDQQVYEWNLDHRSPSANSATDAARLLLTGDENLVELSAVAHYAVADPARYLFSTRDSDRVIGLTAESTLRTVVARHSLDDVLTDRRGALETEWHATLAAALEQYAMGVELTATAIRDAHPPIEVVESFREASSALEERQTRIEIAEGYERRLLPLSRGEAAAIRQGAEADRRGAELGAEGRADRLAAHAGALSPNTDTHRFRLHLDALDRVLPGKRKLITDSKGGRRRFLFVDPGTLSPSNLSPSSLSPSVFDSIPTEAPERQPPSQSQPPSRRDE